MNDIAIQEEIDVLELKLKEIGEDNCPLIHRFTPGLYSRTIYMEKDMLIVSKIHKTEHQFVVLQGIASVWTEEEGWIVIEAPYSGITKPGTRRVLAIAADCIWQTFHPTTVVPEGDSQEEILKAVDKVEDMIIEKREIAIDLLKLISQDHV